MNKRFRYVLKLSLVIFLAVFVLAAFRYAGSPQLNWRFSLARLKMMGALPEESWTEVVHRMLPSRFGGRALAKLPVVSPFDTPEDINEGARLYAVNCAGCHGANGEGFAGPALADPNFARRADESFLFEVITNGVPDTAMPPFSGPPEETLRMTAFVTQMAEEAVAQSRPGQVACEPCQSLDVTAERLNHASDEPGNWLTYSGSYNGARFSTLRQIGPGNVARLRLKWVYQMPRASQSLQTVPLAADGVLFLTGPDNEVIALDAATGKPYWTFTRPVPDYVRVCCGRNNRGVALLGNRVYHGALDNHLIAIDAVTGEPVWDVTVADIQDGYSMTGAPLAVKDKIIVGIAGGEFGVRGFLDAYDAQTGERVWRFHTVPGPGEPGHETWENDAWKTGGGTTWVTGSYDPELDLLYWGVGNPSPLYDGDARPGDNLHTGSVIALDPDSGELQWHFQFTPHDVNDWDATIVPILADLEYQGAPKKLMLWANRNCFYYVLDRETGRFLQATEYCKQNWNDGFTPEGRPIRRENSVPTEDGILIHPGPMGGSNWYSPAFSPLTQLYYVNFRADEQTYERIPEEYSRGRPYMGGVTRPVPGSGDKGGLRAIDATTGKTAWDFEKVRISRTGVLATASGLVFSGDGDGALVALDAATGAVLSRVRLGNEIAAGPITYLHGGKQQLAAVAGGSLFVFETVD